MLCFTQRPSVNCKLFLFFDKMKINDKLFFKYFLFKNHYSFEDIIQ